MANNNYWWHRYGYTDFHELDLTWILTQVQELLSTVETVEVRVEQCETAIEELDSRLDTAEDKIMVLESDMDTAQDDITGLKNRVTSIEGAEIMDATMLKEVASVVPSNANVGISFTKDTYVNGVKSTTTDSATIPSATNTNAGVMLPAEKNKLNAFSVDGSGNATFTGTVSGDDPTSAGNYATKSYVDSLAISGSAEVTYDASPYRERPNGATKWKEFGDTSSTEGDGWVKVWTYGKVIMITGYTYFTTAYQHLAGGTELCSCRIKADYTSIVGEGVTAWISSGDSAPYTMIPVTIGVDGQGYLQVKTINAIEVGTSLTIDVKLCGLLS